VEEQRKIACAGVEEKADLPKKKKLRPEVLGQESWFDLSVGGSFPKKKKKKVTDRESGRSLV